jgi:hypothetical protein
MHRTWKKRYAHLAARDMERTSCSSLGLRVQARKSCTMAVGTVHRCQGLRVYANWALTCAFRAGVACECNARADDTLGRGERTGHVDKSYIRIQSVAYDVSGMERFSKKDSQRRNASYRRSREQ